MSLTVLKCTYPEMHRVEVKPKLTPIDTIANNLFSTDPKTALLRDSRIKEIGTEMINMANSTRAHKAMIYSHIL